MSLFNERSFQFDVHGVKASLRSPLMLPKIAVVDPELTYGLPPEITAYTGLDALTQLIELTKPSPAPLTIVLAKGVTVSGALAAAASQAVSNKEVVLIPDRIANRLDLYKTATTDVNGRFTIQGVAPGDYKAFAWQGIERFQYFDSEFMKQFADRGSAVRVSDAAPATVSVKIIP